MSMTAAVEQAWSGTRRTAIQAAARHSATLADDPQVRDEAAELACVVSDPDASDREVRECLARLALLAHETPRK